MGGNELSYEVAGSGHPLVFIHGGWVDSSMWDDQFGWFANHFQVIRYDLRGHGQSPSSSKPYSPINDLHELLTTLEIQSAYLVGQSVGGGIAMGYTLVHPERTRALITVDSAGVLPDTDLSDQEKQVIMAVVSAAARGNYSNAIEMFLQFWVDGVNRQANPAVRGRVEAMLQAHTWPQFAPSFPGEQWPVLDNVEDILVPTLLVVGEQDRPSFHRAADKVLARVDHAQKTLIPDAAHFSNMDQPEFFNQVVMDFLVQLPKS